MKTKDYDVRAAVVAQLLSEGIEIEDIRHEITLDTSSSGGRVDLCILRPNELWAIEIKSGSDNLKLLSDQISAYRRSFDRYLIVADKRHRDGVSGVLHCGETMRFVRGYCGDFIPYASKTILRYEFEGQYGSSSYRTSHLDMLCLLWRDEVAAVSKYFSFSGNGSRCGMIRNIKENVTLKNLRPAVIAQLRARVLSKWETSFWEKFKPEGYDIIRMTKGGFACSRLSKKEIA